MAYLVIRNIKGKHYAYRQESFRDGSTVRTRTVDYIGAISSAVAEQFNETRRKIGTIEAQKTLASALDVTPTEKPKKPINIGLLLPSSLEKYGVSKTALHSTFGRFKNQLGKQGIADAPTVSVKYGHPDGLKLSKDGSYTVIVSRKPSNKTHQVKKALLWKNYRQALASAHLDAIRKSKPEQFAQLHARLSLEHRKARRATLTALSHSTTPIQAFWVCLSYIVSQRIPQEHKKGKTDSNEYGLYRWETRHDWEAEAVAIWADTLKAGGTVELQTRIKKARSSLKRRVTTRLNKLKKGGALARISRKLSGKERRILREIMKIEAQQKALDLYERRALFLANF